MGRLLVEYRILVRRPELDSGHGDSRSRAGSYKQGQDLPYHMIDMYKAQVDVQIETCWLHEQVIRLGVMETTKKWLVMGQQHLPVVVFF